MVGVVNNQDHSGVSTRFVDMDRNIHMEILDEDRLQFITLSAAGPQVFGGRQPIDRFSSLRQEESYSKPPPPAKAKYSPYKDEQETGFLD